MSRSHPSAGTIARGDCLLWCAGSHKKNEEDANGGGEGSGDRENSFHIDDMDDNWNTHHAMPCHAMPAMRCLGLARQGGRAHARV